VKLSRDLTSLDALARMGTATICEVAQGGVSILDPALRPLAPGLAAAGTAYTVQVRPGDNLAIHHAIADLQPGDMLVVDYGQSLATGPVGEIMALAAQTRGATGMIIDGAVRDSAQIVGLGFAVWCRGLAIPGTIKVDRGVHKQGCTLSGVVVNQGDVIVADQDAVVVLRPDQVNEVLTKGAERVAREDEMMVRIRAGESTLRILGLE